MLTKNICTVGRKGSQNIEKMICQEKGYSKLCLELKASSNGILDIEHLSHHVQQ